MYGNNLFNKHTLNTSDSGLHHTISLMYVGARHLGFGTTWHDLRLGGIGQVVPIVINIVRVIGPLVDAHCFLKRNMKAMLFN